MPTITNGASYRCIWWWDQHFKDDKENVRTDIVASKGLVSDNIYDMLCEIRTIAEAARPDDARWKNFMAVFDISPHPGHQPTEQQWDRMRQIVEEERGLKGEVYFMVEQEKADGRIHRHLVELRIDLQTGRAIPDNWDAPKCHAASRRICEEFGWERIASPFDKDRDPNAPRPERAPKRWESYRAMKSGLSIADITTEVTELRRLSDDGQDFKAALESHAYILARGDRKTGGEYTLMIIDVAGDEHSLVRRLKGVTTKELNEFMRDVDRAALPDIRQAQQMQQERKTAALEADRATVAQEIAWQEKLAQAAIEKEKREPQFIAAEDREKGTLAGGRMAARIQDAEKTAMRDERTREGDPRPHAKAFAEALEQKGIAFAVATPEESYRSHREQAFAKALGRKSDYYAPGEIVAVTEPGLLYHRAGEWTAPPRVHKLDQDQAGRYLEFLDIDKSKLTGIDATKSMLDTGKQARAAYWQEIRLGNATRQDHHAPERGPRNRTAEKIMDAGAAVALGAGLKGLDIVASIFESILAPKLTPEQIRQAELTRQDREADTERAIDFSRYTADAAQDQRSRQAQQEQAARDRERERENERDR